MSQFFASGGQSIGALASASIFPMNIQCWFPLVLTGFIFLLSKGLSRVCSSITVQEHQRIDVFETAVLKKMLESPLDSKEIKPVNPKGNQHWIFIGKTDVEAEAPILWLPDAKSQLIGKDPDAGKDWGQEKWATEDEMVGWHHWLSGHEFEWTPGDSKGQESLACCGSWIHKKLETTELLNNRDFSLPFSQQGELWRAILISKENLSFQFLFHLVCSLSPAQFLSLVLLLYPSPFLGFIYQPQQLGRDRHAGPPSQHGVTIKGSWKTTLGTLVHLGTCILMFCILTWSLMEWKNLEQSEDKGAWGTRPTWFPPGHCLDLHQDPIHDRSRGLIRMSYLVHSVFSQGHCQKGHFAGSHLHESK